MNPRTKVLRYGVASLLAFLSPLLISPALAGGGNSGGGSTESGTPPSSPGSDDVETIPFVSSGGFEVEVNSWQLPELLRGVVGKGRIEMRPSRSGKVAVQFTGSFRIQLETRHLRSRALLVRYHGVASQMRVVSRQGRMVLLQR